MKRHFTEQQVWMVQKLMKICFASLVIGHFH